MKIINKIDDLIIYIPHYDKEKKVNNKNDLAIYLKEIFIKLKNQYDIKLYTYYNGTIYLNDEYGIICELFHDDECEYSSTLDIKINIYFDAVFMYKINNTDEKYNNKYLYKNQFYTKKPIDIKNCEFLEVVYGEKAKRIIRNGIKCN